MANNAIVLGLGTGLCLIIMALAAIRFWLSGLRVRHGRADPARVAHLKDHLVASGGLKGPAQFSFPDDFYQKALYLTGEIHGYGAMAAIDYDLLVHLNQRAGVRDYIAELSPVEAALLNAYLASGDDGVMTPVFATFKGTMRWSNTEFPEKVRKIRAYNAPLAPEARIAFIGLDMVQNFDLLHQWLGLKEPRLEATDGRALAAACLPQVEAADPSGLTGGETAKTEVMVALKAMAAGLEREAVIFENYAHQVTKGRLGDRPAYGLWGTIHTLRAPINKGFIPFAARVAASNLPAARSMACVVAYSDGGAVMMANTEFKGLFRSKTHSGVASRFLENDGPVFYLEGLGDLRAAYQASGLPRAGFGVFATGGAGTPFSSPSGFGQIHTTYRFGISFDAPKKPVAEMFDYALLVRGSSAATPVKL